MFQASSLTPVLLFSSMLMTAQPDGPPPPPAPPRPRLPLDIGLDVEPRRTLVFLGIPAVQRELSLAPNSLARAREVSREMRQFLESAALDYVARRRDLVLQGADGVKVKDLDRERLAVLEVLQQQSESAIRGILDPRQRTRLEQIELQAIGPGVFVAPNFKEVRARLNLDAGQAEAIGALANRCSDELIRVTTPPPKYDDPGFTLDQRRAHGDSMRSEAAKVRESTMKAIDRVLTGEQRAAYQAMLGEPFDFSSLWPKPFEKAP